MVYLMHLVAASPALQLCISPEEKGSTRAAKPTRPPNKKIDPRLSRSLEVEVDKLLLMQFV